MQIVLKEEVGSFNVIIVAFNGQKARFDQITLDTLQLFETIFGPKMWNHVVAETTYWSHSQSSVDHRLNNREVCYLMI